MLKFKITLDRHNAIQNLNYYVLPVRYHLPVKGPKLEIFGFWFFFHKSDLYGLVTKELGKRIQNFDSLGLKIADLYFLALSPTSLNNFKRYRRRRKKFLSAVGDGDKKFYSLSAISLKIFYRRRRQRLKK
jgi:hypothetical protein